MAKQNSFGSGYPVMLEILQIIRQYKLIMKSLNAQGRTLLTQATIAFLVAITCSVFSADVQAQAFEGFPDARMRDFDRQRACEQNLPTCLPQVRRQMEQRQTKQLWMGGMIGGVLVLIFLLAVRANNQKKEEQQEELRRGREASRQRQRKHAKPESDDDTPDGGQMRSKLERPQGFGRR